MSYISLSIKKRNHFFPRAAIVLTPREQDFHGLGRGVLSRFVDRKESIFTRSSRTYCHVVELKTS